jgi:hypothetical protein
MHDFHVRYHEWDVYVTDGYIRRFVTRCICKCSAERIKAVIENKYPEYTCSINENLRIEDYPLDLAYCT